jgi:Mg-chelatase subunit ChlD
LTGRDFGVDQRAWLAHLKALPNDFVCAPLPKTSPTSQQGDHLRYGPRFYGLTVDSNRVIFVCDRSGSMQADQKILVLKDELLQAIDGMPAAARFNLIPFADRPDAWMKRLVPADAHHRNEAKARIYHLGAVGGTDLYGAVMTALADPDADTIFVVSDGMPSAGEERDPWQILRRVRKINRSKRIAIHTVFVSATEAFTPPLPGQPASMTGSRFLTELATQNGGGFVWRRP